MQYFRCSSLCIQQEIVCCSCSIIQNGSWKAVIRSFLTTQSVVKQTIARVKRVSESNMLSQRHKLNTPSCCSFIYARWRSSYSPHCTSHGSIVRCIKSKARTVKRRSLPQEIEIGSLEMEPSTCVVLSTGEDTWSVYKRSVLAAARKNFEATKRDWYYLPIMNTKWTQAKRTSRSHSVRLVTSVRRHISWDGWAKKLSGRSWRWREEQVHPRESR